jgi:hypothetical protein
MNVWVVNYTHKHGTDIAVCASEVAAYQWAAIAILDSKEEIEDKELVKTFEVSFELREFSKIFELWVGYQNREDAAWSPDYMEILVKEVVEEIL